MKKKLFLLANSTLFTGISEEDIQTMSKCLTVNEHIVRRDDFFLHAGDPVGSVYFLLSGSMHIVSEDFWGNRSIIETMQKGLLFGEAYVFAARKSHLINVIAAEDSVVLEMDPAKLFDTCSSRCACHARLMKNTLFITSEKIVRLTEKLQYIIRRTTREKVLSYFSTCARQEKSAIFTIPYSRQQLADYLCVDRSALSHELSKLQSEGLLRYRKNRFELLAAEEELV